MHCTGGTGRTATMLISYIWYKIYLLEKSHSKALNKLLKRLVELKASPEELLLVMLDNPIIQYMKDQLKKYSSEAEHEMFEDPGLLCKRVIVITEACMTYKGKPNPIFARSLKGSVWKGKQSEKPAKRSRSLSSQTPVAEKKKKQAGKKTASRSSSPNIFVL